MTTPQSRAAALAEEMLARNAGPIGDIASRAVEAAITTLAQEVRRSRAERVIWWTTMAVRAWLRSAHWGKSGKPARAYRWRRRFERRAIVACSSPPLMDPSGRVVTGRALLLAAGVPAGLVPGEPLQSRA